MARLLFYFILLVYFTGEVSVYHHCTIHPWKAERDKVSLHGSCG